MIIIAGYTLVDIEKWTGLVDAPRDLVSRARESDGCIHVAVTADSVNAERINSVEVLAGRRGHGPVARAAAPEVAEAQYTWVKRHDATNRAPLY